MKNLIERIKAPETKVGRFLIWIGGVLVLVISAIGQYAEYLGMIPHDWIPPEIKTIVVCCSLLSLIIGKLTKQPEYGVPKHKNPPTPPQPWAED
jgi:hypothetical protein